MYNRIRAMWPKEVDISDGRRVRRTPYFYFPTLSSIRSDIEDRIDHKVDHWGSVGAWAFWQAAHCKAIDLHRRGERTLDVDSIEVALFDHYVKSNLAGEGWEKERNEYRGL